ncbi:MAG: amidohydrolase family protein [Gammaproteobacteria bacterium]|nr:amidohydrolase family protein [Gammaproteobacteria bacterium]
MRQARTQRERLHALPESCRPQSIEDGSAIQAALVNQLNEPIAGWKIGSTNIRALELVGTTGPISAPRLADMRQDGISGEVIFPILGARLYGIIDGDPLSVCCRAGNDWLLEQFGAVYSAYFEPVAVLNVHDIEMAVDELTRCADRGIAGVMIPTYPGEDHPYYTAAYVRLWGSVQDFALPLCMHVAACCRGPGQRSIFAKDWQQPGTAAYSTTQDDWVRRLIGSMIFAGVFERFPGLNVAIVEHELAWAPYLLKQMDTHYTELSQTAPYRFVGDRLPGDFFTTNLYLIFQEDKLGLDALLISIGVDTLMFGSDYPHAESTWSRSQQYLGELLRGKTPDDRARLTRDNASALFGFDL